MHIYIYTCRIHFDAIIMTSDTVLRKICTSHFIVRFVYERELEINQNCNILTPTLMAISIMSFLFSRAAQPEARWLSLLHLVSNSSDLQLDRGSQRPVLLGGGFLYHIFSPTSLISNSLGSRGPLLPGGGFLYHILSLTFLISNSLTSCLHRVI